MPWWKRNIIINKQLDGLTQYESFINTYSEQLLINQSHQHMSQSFCSSCIPTENLQNPAAIYICRGIWILFKYQLIWIITFIYSNSITQKVNVIHTWTNYLQLIWLWFKQDARHSSHVGSAMNTSMLIGTSFHYRSIITKRDTLELKH